MSPNSKRGLRKIMELLYNYQIAPGCCHRCRTTKPGKIIDLRREDPAQVLRQAVYLCEDCITAAYMLLNTPLVLVDRQVLADKDGEITALANEITRLMDEAAAMDARLVRAIASQGVDA